MFTGLIETTGSILAIEPRAGSQRIAIAAPSLLGAHSSKLAEGGSIAVSGVCLTATRIEADADPPRFYADLAAETIARTTLAALKPGAEVNLELPTPAGAPLGGHIVQGHVDGTGILLDLSPVDPGATPELADRRLRIALPADIGRYMVEKGSIAVEGISLTIALWEPKSGENGAIEIAIIPHTYAKTNLRSLAPGARMNLEADVMLKYFDERRRASGITAAGLIANGY